MASVSLSAKIPALFSMIAYWVVGLPIGYYLMKKTEVGPPGLWWGLTIGLGIVAVLLALRVVSKLNSDIKPVEHSS